MIEWLNKELYVEAIKLAASGVQYKNLSIKRTLVESIKQLAFFSETLNDIKYLEIATLYIEAYLEMGFSYEEEVELFDGILGNLNMNKELQFPKRFYKAKVLKLNKTQIKSVIGRWPASPHQKMKINEVIDDIMDKVKEHRNGIFYYKCEVTLKVFELVINSEEIFLHDINKGWFYTFVI